MSDFALEAWEQAIEFPSPFKSAAWETEELSLGWIRVTSSRWMVMGREKNKPDAGNWTVLDSRACVPQLWTAKAPKQTLLGLASNWAELEKGRLFAWPDKSCVMRANGSGQWLASKPYHSVSFHLTFTDEEWKNSEMLWSRVEREMMRSEADISFSAVWHLSDVEEKRAILYGQKKYEELLDLMRYVVYSTDDFDGEVWWRIGFNEGGFAQVTSPNCVGDAELGRRTTLWSQFLKEDFLPRIVEVEKHRHPLLERFASGWDAGPTLIRLQAPTQHERIEARLRLREWLEHNAPDRMDLLP